jgi:hypothetical protein
MLIAMADESGVNTDGYFGMAGYIGTHEDWTQLNGPWSLALAKHKAPYLHMLEFSGSRGAYKGWTEEQRRALMSDLLMAITGTALRAFGIVMRVADFADLPEHEKTGLVGPYMLCWQELVFVAGIHEIDLFPGERVHFIYSRQDDFKRHMKLMWTFAKDNLPVARKLGVLEFQDMRDVPGLQATDLLAYEIRHLYHLRDTRPDLNPRFPYRVLMAHQQTLGAQMFKFLPRWLIQAQIDNVPVTMMEMVLRNLERYGRMYRELQLPLVEPRKGTGFMRVLERYKPWTGNVGDRNVFDRDTADMKRFTQAVLSDPPWPSLVEEALGLEALAE